MGYHVLELNDFLYLKKYKLINTNFGDNTEKNPYQRTLLAGIADSDSKPPNWLQIGDGCSVEMNCSRIFHFDRTLTKNRI